MEGGPAEVDQVGSGHQRHGVQGSLGQQQAFGEDTRQRLAAQVSAGRLELLLQSDVQAIEADSVTIKTEKGLRTMPNQVVIVCAGGELPTPFLKKIGVMVQTHHGAVANG